MIQNGPGSRGNSNGFIVLLPGKRIGKSVNRSTDLTEQVIESLVPFKDQIVVKSVTGSVLEEVLEKSVNQ